MKKVMTGAMIAAAVALGGAGSAAAAQQSPEQGARQDCRTYSSVTECGKVQLNEKQRACVTSSVQLGMTERRAEVECSAFG
ncbi:hypothetical protein AGRA3207_004859 [Actinomadura graeca]|uniref:DUF3551 domain-containing protein n=1 Tax=Actinomadura graeca TaxID=2750812 RepID=A0ABX8QXU5_9ACTN|nr:hypothetical protein [Actinomadura graeca]QXJ23669.1 hypothetical protein AGRA3207_004859 [Actinomadura graeca]